MIQKAKELQISAVKKLIDKSESQSELTFKAPTGTGKTYMMADMMNQLLEKDPNLVFLVSSLSKGELAEQNYESFLEYKEHGKFPLLNPYLITTESADEERITIPETYNVYVLPRDLYRNKGKLMQGPMNAFLRNITTGDITTGIGKGKHIYLIKDECHQKTKNLDDISSDYFEKIYNFSATPNLKRGQVPDVQISDADAVDAKLIKSIVWGNEDESLDDVLKKYCEEIKPKYEEQLGMVPCIIIQISNKDLAKDEWEKIIQPALEKHNIQWMYIVNEDKDCMTNHRDFIDKPVSLWKKYAKKDSSTIEAIVFKLTISEGWDIRRACMLYQIRSPKSMQLNEQVLGRIRRNPKLLSFEEYDEDTQTLATTAWAWGMQPPIDTKPVSVEVSSPTVQNDLKLKTTVITDLPSQMGFDVDSIINSQNKKSTSPSIFELYNHYEKANDDIRRIGRNYIKTIQDWFSFTTNLSAITKEYNKKICDYDKSMQLLTDDNGELVLTSVPNESLYYDTDHYNNISDNIWERKDGKDDFAYDSEAEKEFADLLIRLSSDVAKKDSGVLTQDIYLWGKNYPIGSEIRYEYYLNGTHFSYPDFILKDIYDRIHIFEVKSVNEGAMRVGFDANSYEEKILALKHCYLHASKLTKQIFYLPIKEERSWKIIRLMDGEESIITKEQLKEFMISEPLK